MPRLSKRQNVETNCIDFLSKCHQFPYQIRLVLFNATTYTSFSHLESQTCLKGLSTVFLDLHSLAASTLSVAFRRSCSCLLLFRREVLDLECVSKCHRPVAISDHVPSSSDSSSSSTGAGFRLFLPLTPSPIPPTRDPTPPRTPPPIEPTEPMTSPLPSLPTPSPRPPVTPET